MTERSFELSPTVVRQLKTLWSRWGSRRTGSVATDAGFPGMARDVRYQGKLTSDLDAGSLTNPSSAEFQPFFPVDPGDKSKGLKEGMQFTPPITVYNHDAGFSLSSDKYCRVEFLNGAWTIYYGCD